MIEDQEAQEISQDEKLGYLRDQYGPVREEAGKILEKSGLDPETPEFKKARANVARRVLEERSVGEVDTLTGLRNLRGFQRRVSEEIRRAKSEGHRLWLFILDANNLKVVNDTQGHGKGDELLKGIAEILGGKSKARDVVARIGGDEFAVLLTATNEDGVEKYWERMETYFKGIRVSVAAGVTEFRIGEEFDQAKERADESMYKAKEYQKEESGRPFAHLVRRYE